MDTYSKDSEALFYACEGTVARYNDEIAAFLADGIIHSGSASREKLAQEACERVARCKVSRRAEL